MDQISGREHGVLDRVAHDLAEPLNAILAALQVVRTSDDRAVVDRAAQIIERQTHYLRQLVSRLLEDARRHRWHAVLHFVPVNVGEIVGQVIEANRLLCVQRGLEVASELPAEPVWADGDPVLLQEIVWNLLANAVRYTPHGGTIHVRVSQDDDQLVVAVRDSGVGVEPHEARRIFDAFAQGERGSPEGVGLGLAISWELARAHGGSIDVRSAGRGRGSEFRLILPARAPDPRSAV